MHNNKKCEVCKYGTSDDITCSPYCSNNPELNMEEEAEGDEYRCPSCSTWHRTKQQAIECCNNA